MANRLVEKYSKEIAPALNEKFDYKSVMQIPKIDKIVLNMGVAAIRVCSALRSGCRPDLII